MLGRKKQKQSKTSKHKIIIWAVVVILIVGLSTYFVHKINGPVAGMIKQTTSNGQASQDVGMKTLTSDYFSLQYPGRYEIKTSDNGFDSYETWVLIAHQIFGLGQSSKITISLADLPLGGVEADSAYKHFIAFPDVYSVSSSTFHGEPVVVGERSDPSFEHTILWGHDGYLLSISLTSSTKNDKLLSEIKAIEQSFVWR